MLAITPLLILAYAVLYAFAYAIPTGYVQLDVRDALAASKVEVPKVEARTDSPATPARKVKRSFTEAAGPLSMAGRSQGPVMSSGTVTLTTGEGQGFWHRCEGLKC
ncbi:hypothetical protein C1H76_5912 [Elsinoe australis]|uniref:Uncharacterized protein n=1 Tax=Elsinoe australis TaxID=40998 RepID=A0A4U7AV59_9PEZI|nr:hypothetical protein C1H76_5912 [Elsinoe australis]